MSYTTDDFRESLCRTSLQPADVERVMAAWGLGSGMGTDAGHYKWAPDGASDWSGGFLLRLRDGRYCYLTGWCDFTGWGCQDGVETQFFDMEPPIASLRASDYPSEPDPGAWDIEPADLNRWLLLAAGGQQEG